MGPGADTVGFFLGSYCQQPKQDLTLTHTQTHNVYLCKKILHSIVAVILISITWFQLLIRTTDKSIRRNRHICLSSCSCTIFHEPKTDSASRKSYKNICNVCKHGTNERNPLTTDRHRLIYRTPHSQSFPMHTYYSIFLHISSL